ncbi:Fis family transcriptional regulator [Acetobacter sp. DsW_063]|nr:Fis family transcriptional regulator [Acetobacter sp. DsW_063]
MRAVKSANTAPELAVRKLLFSLGYRYRLHRKDLSGSPDIVFPGRRKVIFVHGCFWHGHDCKRGARTPKTNAEYWRTKITRNIERDRRSAATLRDQGWRALTLWECEIGDRDKLTTILRDFLE